MYAYIIYTYICIYVDRITLMYYITQNVRFVHMDINMDPLVIRCDCCFRGLATDPIPASQYKGKVRGLMLYLHQSHCSHINIIK